jgi:hypothetical protein
MNMTRVIFFELSSDQVMDITIDDLQNVLGMQPTDGLVLFDAPTNCLVIAQAVDEIGEDLYVNESGKVFSINGEQESPEKLT